MQTLKPAEPLVTREPQVLLDPSLKPGTYQLQLVVSGDRGESAPAQIRIVIFDPAPPWPVGPVRPGPVLPGPVLPGPVRPGPVLPGPVLPGPMPGPVQPLRATAPVRAAASHPVKPTKASKTESAAQPAKRRPGGRKSRKRT